MSLVLTLASRNLFQDRVRFIATLIGIVFSIVLVMVQIGLFLGFDRMVTTMINHAPADFWVVAKGAKSFEDASLLDSRIRNRILAVNGVAAVVPVVIGFADWQLPSGEATPVFVVGSDLHDGLTPWNLVAGTAQDLSAPGTVAVDKSYFSRLGVTGIGSTGKIRGETARVAAVTSGIRSFTTTPYVFTSLDQARGYMGLPESKTSHFLVRLKPGTDKDRVRQDIDGAVGGIETLTPQQFRQRSRRFWLFGTGAGAALLGGAALGLIVGTVIVAQTIYSSTKDHLYEFATLRAIGSPNGYTYRVIMSQALLNAVIGFAAAAAIGFAVVVLTASSALPVVITARAAGRPFCFDHGDVHERRHRRSRAGGADRSGYGDGAMTGPIIEANGVRKILGGGVAQVEAVKGVDLTLQSGKLTMLMGPSGSGKTTLLSMIGCLLTPTAGSVRVCGQETTGLGAEALAQLRRRYIGFVFQSYHLFPTLTAAENVQLALDVRGERGAAAQTKSLAALQRVGIGPKHRSFPRELSNGEQQRVAIARAVVAAPAVLLADEPTAALDTVNGQAIMTILSAIAKEESGALLVVTHDARLTRFADETLYLKDGELTAGGEADLKLHQMRDLA